MPKTAEFRLGIRVHALTALLALLALIGCRSDEENHSATVIIESEPESGARVKIGGNILGTTPLTLTDMTAGRYYAILELYGYKRLTQTIDMPETGERRVIAQMEQIVGHLTLESEPPEAQVYLDGEIHLGETPITNMPIPIGAHTYELHQENYLTLTGNVVILEDRRYSFTHLLTPMKGEIEVFSRPSGASIYVNDFLQEKTTPASLKVMPGTYTIGVYKKGYITSETVVEMTPNGASLVDLQLTEGEVPPGMVLIPAGEFLFGLNEGAPDESPQRKINLDAYYIDKLEVTNQQFAKVFLRHTYDPRIADYAVTGISWTIAVEYAAAVGKRLPTEMEWEKAARGENAIEYPWGDRFDPELCNIEKDRDSQVTKVGKFRGGASPYGVLDMAGNVYEWTSDWYQIYEGNTQITASYGQVFRVLRGGSYLSEPYDVRAARRHYDKIESAKEDYGLRCAMDVDEDAQDSK